MAEYHPFVIRIEELEGDAYCVTADFQGVTRSGKIPADLPLLDSQEIQQAQSWLERGFIDREYAKDFGSRLFQTLFPAPIREMFREAFGRVAPHNGLRIVLTQPLPVALASLPWELAYDEQGGHGFLARSTSAPLVRHYADMPLPNQLPQEGPLRVLIVTASPKNESPLSAEQEAEEITRPLEKGLSVREISRTVGKHLQHMHSFPDLVRRLRQRRRVQVSILHHATRAKLQSRLIEANNADQGPHVIHFIGHGEADAVSATVLLEDDNGDVDAIPAGEFAEIVGEPTVNLVVLNACETASTVNLFQSVAQETLRRRVPAVIGMQVPILDRAAVDFAREFYGAWAAGEPIESALAYSRRLIRQESPGAAADWGVPVLYMVPLKGLTLEIPVPPLRWPWPVRSLRWVAASVISLLGVIGLLLGLFGDVQSARKPGGVLNFAWPAPTATLAPTPTPTPLPPMPSGFNVAVAEFAQLDATGHLTSSQVASDLSDWLFAAIKRETDQLPPSLRVNTREPEEIGIVEGRDRNARAESAAEVAARHNVTILVYGVVTTGDDGNQVEPEFYVSQPGFGIGSEVAGPDRLGKVVTFTLPLEPVEQVGINKQLNARTQALQHLVKGLAHFYTGEYELAWAQFRSAAHVSSWRPEEGQEVVYLLMGAADLELYDQTREPDQLARAADSFAQAYQLNRDYARSYLGLGTVAFQQAVSHSERGIDAEKLLEAAGWYSDSLEASDQPASAHISVKAVYGLGQVYLAGYESRVPGWSREQAGTFFEQVIAAYDDKRTPDLMWFAGHAHAYLGRLAGLEENWPEMSSKCHKAIDLLDAIPHNPAKASIARYWAWMAFAEEKRNRLDAARDAYRQAIQEGAGAVGREELDSWQAELDRLEKGTS